MSTSSEVGRGRSEMRNGGKGGMSMAGMKLKKKQLNFLLLFSAECIRLSSCLRQFLSNGQWSNETHKVAIQ